MGGNVVEREKKGNVFSQAFPFVFLHKEKMHTIVQFLDLEGMSRWEERKIQVVIGVFRDNNLTEDAMAELRHAGF